MKFVTDTYPNLQIITCAVFDDEGRLISTEMREYSGPVAECKGGASKAEQANADALRAREADLMGQSLNAQLKQLDAVNSVVDPMIAQGGMSQEQQAAMTSLLMNQLPQTFNNIQGQINQNLVARGISGGPTGAGSGDIARNFGQLGAMEGQIQQQGLANIQLQKAQQLQNLLGLKLGIGSQYGQNTQLFNQGTLGALNAGVTAANNADQASTGLWGSIIGSAAGLGGKFIKPRV